MKVIGVLRKGSAGKTNPLQMRGVAKLSVEGEGASGVRLAVGCDSRKLERKLCNSALSRGNNIGAVIIFRLESS